MLAERRPGRNHTSAVRIIVAGVLLAMAVGCREIPLPDAGVAEAATDRRGEIIIDAWEMDLGQAFTNGCRLYGLRVICDW